jgi:hypothetical protein
MKRAVEVMTLKQFRNSLGAKPGQIGLPLLILCGQHLDWQLDGSTTIRDWLMGLLLKINHKEGREVSFQPNDGQRQSPNIGGGRTSF